MLRLVCGVVAGEVAGLRRELVGAQALLTLFRQQALLSAQRITELEEDNTRCAPGQHPAARRAGGGTPGR
ncbi:MAG: hypothetical protein ACRD0K_21385 [Egibacteraceae bacterium]